MLNVCLIGAGPRGLSVLERLSANEHDSPAHEAVTVHLVDPYPPGPGRVWRTGQSRHLLMNTVASQVSIYTDHSVLMNGPVRPGPSLYEWATGLASDAHRPQLPARFSAETLAEARRLGPDDFPTRAFYGDYLTDAFRRLIADAPDHVTVVEHRTSAVALSDEPGPGRLQRVRLSDGGVLTGLHAVVLSLGHLPAAPTQEERALAGAAATRGLTYIAPVNPADADLSVIEPGETVFVRGLGLTFFDVVALLTEGRGGVFERSGEVLRYRPSGREPRIVAGSRRGVPYHARGENQKGTSGRHEPRLLTTETVARLHRRSVATGGLCFRTDLWPLIAKEVESVYYGTLLSARGRGSEREQFVPRYLTAQGPVAEARLLTEVDIAPADRWDWKTIARPYRGQVFTGHAEFRAWLLDHLAEDVRQARAGNVDSPVKAALDVLRDLRNEIRLAVDHGRLEGNSYRDDLQGWYTPLNAFLSIGPPASRIEELSALIVAGVVDVLGPEIRLRAPSGQDPDVEVFTVNSDLVPGPPVSATALIEARLPAPDLARCADPLLADLLGSGQATSYRIRCADGTGYETTGLAVTEQPYQILDAAGRVHPRRFAYGVPTEAVHWVTAAGPRPGVNSVTFADSDAIARAVLALVGGAARGGTATDGVGVLPTDYIEVNA